MDFYTNISIRQKVSEHKPLYFKLNRLRKVIGGPNAKRLLPILMIFAFVGGCNLPSTQLQTAAETPEEHLAQDLNQLSALTQQAPSEELSEPTPTLAATASRVPTETATPEVSSDGVEYSLPLAPKNLVFRYGGTISYLQGEITAGENQTYTVLAGKGQTMIAGVSSNDQDVYFELKGLDDGQVLLPLSEKSSYISVKLPKTQAYQITLISPTDNVYFLSVEVPAEIDVKAGDGPITVKGYVDVLQQYHPSVFTRVRYLIKLEQGTTLYVQLKSKAIEDLTLALTGKDDGQPYLRYVVKSNAINGFIAPVSQDYYLDVYSISGESADFTLEMDLQD
jgi:hypothetical protein